VTDNRFLALFVLVFCVGLGAGLAVGRWWAFVVPVIVGVWAGRELEIDGRTDWVFGLFLAVIAAAGTALGIPLRRLAGRLSDRLAG
jgi:hypothetical protein